MIIRPQDGLSNGNSSSAFDRWMKTAIGRRVESSHKLFSVRHVGRSPHAFELELGSDAAHVWLSSTDDRVEAVDWRPRLPRETRAAIVLLDAFERLEDAGLNIDAGAHYIADELSDESRDGVRETHRRGVPRSVVRCLREMTALGKALGDEGEASIGHVRDLLGDERDGALERPGDDEEDREPTPPLRLPEDLLALSPSEQDVYALMVEGTLPGPTDPDRRRSGPLYRWVRTPEYVWATYGERGVARVVGISGAYRVKRYADGRRCVVEASGRLGYEHDGHTLAFWADSLEKEARRLVSALVDIEEALPLCSEMPAATRAALSAALPRQRQTALRLLYELASELVSASAPERLDSEGRCLP